MEFKLSEQMPFNSNKPALNHKTIFNPDNVKDINERFGRLIKQLGSNNKRGSLRYKFEVNFAYALHEIAVGPLYLQGKMFDAATAVVSDLITLLKRQKEEVSA